MRRSSAAICRAIYEWKLTLRSRYTYFASLGELFVPGADLVDHGAATGLFGVPMAVRVRAGYYSRGKSLFGVVSTFFTMAKGAVDAPRRSPQTRGRRLPSNHDMR